MLYVAPDTVGNWQGPYMDGSLEELADPWGRPFLYRCPARYSDRGYDLWSMGPDGKDDAGAQGSDDITNWGRGE